MTKVQLPASEVLPTAGKLVEQLADCCLEIAIAGSLRRQCPAVGDIEVVCIPRRMVNLLGEVDADARRPIDARLAAWQDAKRVTFQKNGPKYKQFSLRLPCRIRIQVDLFLTDADCWPVIFALRTGPADFSKAIVTPRDGFFITSGGSRKPGLLRAGHRVREGRLRGPELRAIELRDEAHFFEYVEGGWPTWCDPRDRL